MRARNRGFVLMLALVLIVSLAAIGVYLLTVATGQLEAGIQDEQGARAYQAARTGLEWGAYRVLRDPPFAVACAAAVQTQNLTYINGLSGFYGVVTCQSAGNETEAGSAVRMFRITSKGCNQAGCPAASLPIHVERELQLTLSN